MNKLALFHISQISVMSGLTEDSKALISASILNLL